jgi:hypothetical protein
MPEIMPVLAPWANFYTMTGSAAAALTGLMFVVITLIFGENRRNPTPDGIGTFSTPTVLHFCNALFISAILVAPWHTIVIVKPLVGIIGLCGVLYIFRLVFRQLRLTSYKPDLEDWTWFTFAPFVAYAAILASAIMLNVMAAKALFVIGGSVVLLIFIGIRNSWDVVTYMAVNDTETDTTPT